MTHQRKRGDRTITLPRPALEFTCVVIHLAGHDYALERSDGPFGRMRAEIERARREKQAEPEQEQEQR